MFGEPHAELRFNVGFELISGYTAYVQGAQYHGMKTYLQKAWSVRKFACQHGSLLILSQAPADFQRHRVFLALRSQIRLHELHHKFDFASSVAI